jgi:hypothetical protein
MPDVLLEPWRHIPTATVPLPPAPAVEPRPDITHELSELTDRVTALRVVTKMQKEGRLPPLIEIKGLGAVVASAKKGIADVRAETSGLSVAAAALISAVQDVRAQIKQAHEDLKFEAETLGNGGGAVSETTTGASASG